MRQIGILWIGLGILIGLAPYGFGREEEGVSPLPERDQGGPSIRQVQQAAIGYAEVPSEKIARWRALARWKALLPRLSLGLDQDRDRTVASATASGKTTFSIGPEDESVSLGLSLTWDLGDLIWSTDQISIDTRSRLLVKLRREILEEVTRVYFERQRLQAEFQANPTEDPILQKERRLRMEELAAQLDALTGGYFSQAQISEEETD